MRTARTRWALIAFSALVAAFFCVAAPRFATAANVENLLSGFSFVAILALGQSFALLVGGVDLSIGAIVGLVGMIVFDLSQMLHAPGLAILPIALAAGALAGALNGVLIVFLRLQPFVATLATLGAYRGLTYAISGRQLMPELTTKPIRDPWLLGVETYFDPGEFLGLSNYVNLPSIPLSFLILLALAGALQLVVARTRFGADLRAVGGNFEAARLAGIDTGAVIVSAYALSGLCASVTALIMVARFTTATEALGIGMELTSIAAAVIGGVSLAGGVGEMIGPAIGAFLLGIILLGLTLLNVQQFVQQIISGFILLAAVGSDRAFGARRRRLSGATAGV